MEGYIHLKVKAGAKKEIFEKIDDTHFEISVKEKAEKNMANTRVLEIVREYFKTNNIRIVNGHHSPSKLLIIGD